MRNALWNQRDFWAGVMFASFGVATVVIARNYTMGTAARMGPGYFPTLLGALLAGLGILIVVRAILRRSEVDGIAEMSLRPLLVILASVVGFGLLLHPLGLVAASFVAMMIAAAASHEFRWHEAAINAAVVTAMNWGVFIFGLRLTMPVWPRFVTG